MYARAQGGTFVLRIEDTDMERSKKEFEDEILQSMQWLGMNWDELEYQSKRFDIYREHAEKLLAEGKAYKDGEAIILKMIPDQEIKIYDLIRDEITFNSSDLKDQVLMKSDGSPAYSFCCVVDDALMEITHVIRGEDHISNTPKQIMIYRALDWKPPKYAHLPLIMGEDGSRLSKRTGAVAVSDYKTMGYLSDAIVNYLMLLGWSPGNNQEKVLLEQAVKKFSIKKVNKAAAIFSMDKLNWLNNAYLKEMSTDDVAALLKPRLEAQGYVQEDFDEQKYLAVVELYKGRLNTLNDFLDWADFAFLDQIKISEELREKHLRADRTEAFHSLCTNLNNLEDFSTVHVEATFKAVAEEVGMKTSEFVQPVRVAVTAKAVGPSLFHIMSILGKETVVNRLQNAYN